IVFAKSKIITRENLPDFFLVPEDERRDFAAAGGAELNLRDQTIAFQKRLIVATLKKTKGVQKNAASLLGVKPTTLNEMIKRLRIDVSEF
ncbi:MAG: sigma-54-dependent Fis family transcriptional regulator, partial [Candidatus Aminicenantes bacterium]|nr:sigma-54-dependent Fis family transcriptional regulator [Candidatus Aminicenantes bacterium]